MSPMLSPLTSILREAIAEKERNKLSIVIVGGHDCMHCQYKQICKKHGCKCKIFTQCPADFQNRIGTPEMIIIFTNTVAHKMLNVASKQAERTGTRIRYVNSSSASALQDVLSRHFQSA